MKVFYPPQTNDFGRHKKSLRGELGIDVDACPFTGAIMDRRSELEAQTRDAKYSKPSTLSGQIEFAPPPDGRGRKADWQVHFLNAALLWVHPVLEGNPIALAVIESLYGIDKWLENESWSTDADKNSYIQAHRDRAASAARKKLKKASELLRDPMSAGPVAHILNTIDADTFDSLRKARIESGATKDWLSSLKS